MILGLAASYGGVASADYSVGATVASSPWSPSFSFPDDAHWSEAEQAVEFSVTVGEFKGSVFVPRRVFQTLHGSRPTPEQCVQHYHLNRTALERVVEAKVRERQLDDDANIRISGRDLGHLKAR